MKFYQKPLTLPAFSQGCHIITSRIVEALPELREIQMGMLNLFIQHTSASLTINENADRDVPRDLENLMTHWAPEDFPYRHTLEGRDDMPAHGKASLMGASLNIPVREGTLQLGIWQGIYLCEHRHHGGRRNLMLTLWGE
ncbi:MAG: secondary thiamine-phosphate synthase enzyme YjbQ [Planctomycetia bacterium]|nr:secondary thiamine-phosphate synthase enzyme YjbQ [Planctomycetia bacterium]